MITTELPSTRVRIEGAVELRAEQAGVRPSRVPSWARGQLPSEAFGLIADAATGVRLRTRTSATVLELRLSLLRPELPGVGVLPAVFDLRIDGRAHRRQLLECGGRVRFDPSTGTPEVVPGPPVVIRFDDLPAGEKTIEVWLPHTAICDLVSLGADADVEAPTPSLLPRWVHYGSSISQAAEAAGPLDTWPAVAATSAGTELTCLGFAGNAMLDPFVARTIRDLPAELISLEIGVNIVEQATMRTRTFLPAVHGFLDTIREGHPHTPVVVISPIALPVAEDRAGIIVPDPTRGPRALGTPADVDAGALTMRIVREHLVRIVAQRAEAGELLTYLSGLELLGLDEAADLYDGIHPSATAHLRIGDRFAKVLGYLRPGQSAEPPSLS